MTSSEYENLVSTLIVELTRGPGALGRVEVGSGRKNKIAGASGFRHQVDVSLKADWGLLLFDCKYWTDPVDAEAVLVMASRLADVRVANSELEVKAGIVSTKSPTIGAEVLARYFGVQLDVVSTPREYALRIRERFFLGLTEPLPVSLSEGAAIVAKGDVCDEVVFFARADRVKMRNLRRDPRLVISVQDTTAAASGLMQYLTLRGTARIRDGQPIDDLMDRLTRRYLGRDRFPFPRDGQTAVHVAVERLGGNGPWIAGD